MMTNGDEYNKKNHGNDGHDEQTSRSVLLDFYALRLGRPDAEFNFNPIKEAIIFSTQQIGLAKSEQERYGLYCSLTDHIMAAIENCVEVIRTTPKRSEYEDKIITDFDELLNEMDSCMEGYVQVKKSSAGDDFNEYDIGINIPSKTGSTEMAFNGHVTSTMKNYEVSTDLVTENLYRRLNCNARPMFRKAFRLAVRVKFLDPDEKMNIKGTGIDADKASSYQKNMSSQLGGGPRV